MQDIHHRAELLRDQILKTWSPPLKSGGESSGVVAQTSVMLTIAFLLGKDFLGQLTEVQQRAIDSGLELFEEVLIGDTVSSKEGAS